MFLYGARHRFFFTTKVVPFYKTALSGHILFLFLVYELVLLIRGHNLGNVWTK